MNESKFVFDTNIFISAILIDDSISARALDKAFTIGEVVFSDATFSEFTQVLFRPKFDKYLTDERRLQTIAKLKADTLRYNVLTVLTVCRDPKDNKFLELAVDSKAACIITGDKDLLILHPFREISILTASEFIDTVF
ncbi:MAG TPA: putative toxin-antitoxin system toxin component, PIN family [Mucilaginibacter sp.]|nr:putative toxin-antitoxin system toxin component, PIN family [Mucilaginibacter sp.]